MTIIDICLKKFNFKMAIFPEDTPNKRYFNVLCDGP